ncbi:secreted protein containing DUF1559 [Rhodopirellula maiorica SM1]|uniref:Secreted protein containing DUF1559 n=1 Tax=Rhodopirellula maiorica SM1 TaxID=1265738 RepID=M5RK95_9BACT|nr:DUF1559 domain-containing protein [Rhodopirellula maiorica]EMI19743.1 secreted protein containing DUF1559 [Rhodopirellula maiorica SM1]
MFSKMFPVIALLVCSPLVATAQDRSTKSRLMFPSGVVMHDTIAAAHLDLTQIDVPTTVQILSKLTGKPGESPFVPLAEGVIKSLLDAGVKQLYVTLPGRALLHGGVCIVAPCSDKDSVSKLFTNLLDPISLPYKFDVLETEHAVVICPAVMASEYQNNGSREQVDRDEFNAGLQSMASFAHQAVISLPADIHQELTLLWPEKLSDHDPTGFSPQRWVASVRSISMGWDFPPATALELRFQCTDHDGATACEQEMSKLLMMIPPGIVRPKLSVDSNNVVIKADPEEINVFLKSISKPARQDAQRRQTINNFKQLALAIHNFHGKHGFLPGKYTVDAEGRPLLSWRVALLPYLDQASLYAKFKLDEPWDSERNRPLSEQMPQVFEVAGDDLAAGHSRIRLPVIAGGLWAGEGPPRTLRNMIDGTSNTVWIATAPPSAAVTWTKPDDWKLEEAKLSDQFFADQSDAIVSFADGSARALTPTIAAETLKALLTMAGGEVVPQDEVK